MDIFNCEVTPLYSLTSLLAFSCTANESVRGWCGIHYSRTSLSRSIIDSESEVAWPQVFCLLSDLLSYFSKGAAVISRVSVTFTCFVTLLLDLGKRLVVSLSPLVANLNLVLVWGAFGSDTIVTNIFWLKLVRRAATLSIVELIASFVAHFVVVLSLRCNLILERFFVECSDHWLFQSALVSRHVVELVVSHREVWLDAPYASDDLVCIFFPLLHRERIFIVLTFEVVAILCGTLWNIKVLWRQVWLSECVH